MTKVESYKTKVYLENRCYLCNQILSSPPALINHLESKHQIFLNKRKSGVSRPLVGDYMYVKTKNEATRLHLACPSCWFHCSENNSHILAGHIETEHLKAFDIDMANSTKIKDEDSNRKSKEDEILYTLEDLTNTFKKLFKK